MCATLSPFGISGGIGMVVVCVLVMMVPSGRLTEIPCCVGIMCLWSPCDCRQWPIAPVYINIDGEGVKVVVL
jgi:hypothetical protein